MRPPSPSENIVNVQENKNGITYEALFSPKVDKTTRFVSFNVNGTKTLFNYYPWNNTQQNYDRAFELMNADVISLQELKLSPSNISSINIGNLENYRSFISLPKSKRGYSGVGLFVHKRLSVIKAEEGITGWLTNGGGGTDGGSGVPYRESESPIGGYPKQKTISKERSLEIDSEGRTIFVELGGKIVVVSVYCPANSMGTEKGEEFRMEFLSLLLQRCYDLKHIHGKDVILMGDINVSLDLIDHADTIQELMKSKLVKPVSSPEIFEVSNMNACIEFKTSKPARELLNRFTVPTLSGLHKTDKQFFHDTTRYIQGRRLGMYTVWNTMTSARQSNYGSRIDLILASSKELLENVELADIWPLVNGSDHCPVFTDFKLSDEVLNSSGNCITLKFEAKSHFKLVRHTDILQHFMTLKSNPEPKKPITNVDVVDSQPQKKRKLEYVSRKKSKQSALQTSISNFFFKDPTTTTTIESPTTNEEPTEDKQQLATGSLPISITSLSNLIYGQEPNCLHGEPCQLKTSLNNIKTRGKKFWCCARNQVGMNSVDTSNTETIGDYRCNFFEWAKKTS